jgi:hypothetical protein
MHLIAPPTAVVDLLSTLPPALTFHSLLRWGPSCLMVVAVSLSHSSAQTWLPLNPLLSYLLLALLPFPDTKPLFARCRHTVAHDNAGSVCMPPQTLLFLRKPCCFSLQFAKPWPALPQYGRCP